MAKLISEPRSPGSRTNALNPLVGCKSGPQIPHYCSILKDEEQVAQGEEVIISRSLNKLVAEVGLECLSEPPQRPSSLLTAVQRAWSLGKEGVSIYIELAKCFIRVFLKDDMENPEWTFWPTQYLSALFHLKLGTSGQFESMAIPRCLGLGWTLKERSTQQQESSLHTWRTEWSWYSPWYLLKVPLPPPGSMKLGSNFLWPWKILFLSKTQFVYLQNGMLCEH